jgi:hypothetical protein
VWPGESHYYVANVIASQDNSRMAGTFSWGQGEASQVTAWLRLSDAPNDVWLPRPPIEVSFDTVTLRLSEGAPLDSGLPRSESYRLFSLDGAVGGDLGAFWRTEVAVRESDDAIIAGPVPPTDPSIPVGLEIRRDGERVIAVQATLPSGTVVALEPVVLAEEPL